MEKQCLSFFPTPYPDEDFDSIIHRYHLRSGNVNYSITTNKLFNYEQKITLNNLLPQNIDILTSKMPDNSPYTSTYFVMNHTMYPLIKPFLPQSRANKIISYMKQNHDKYKSPGNALGSLPIGIISKGVKFCPFCINDNIELYGESYIHRIQQFYPLRVCPKVSVKLYTPRNRYLSMR